MPIRKEIIFVPLACLLFAWIYGSVKPAYTWLGLMDRWGIANQEQFTILAILGLALIAITLVLRIIRDPGGNE